MIGRAFFILKAQTVQWLVKLLLQGGTTECSLK